MSTEKEVYYVLESLAAKIIMGTFILFGVHTSIKKLYRKWHVKNVVKKQIKIIDL